MYFTAANVQAATKTGFVTINGESYYINEDGSKQKGWLELEGKKYYFNTKTGVQVKGWVTDSKGRKRYFSKQAGCLLYTSLYRCDHLCLFSSRGKDR